MICLADPFGGTPLQDTYLSNQFLVSRGIFLGPQGLLKPGQEDGNDDTRFYAFSKADEED